MDVPILSHKKIRDVSFDRRHPAVSVNNLADMLALDLLLGRKDDFCRRLQGALDNACLQGLQMVNARQKRAATKKRLVRKPRK